MSIYHGRPCIARRFQLVLSSFLLKDGLPFADVLPEEQFEAAFAEEDARATERDI
jgi:hypothetical protein